MKKNRVLQRFIGILIAACLLLAGMPATALFTTVHAAEADNTIWIGYIDYDGFIQKQADGGYTGYGVAYLEEIAKYTGWNYEFVYDSWDGHLENLKNGTIDFLCHAQLTPERQEDYLFSKYTVGDESDILYVRSNDDRYYYNDFEYFDGMRLAMLAGSYQNGKFADYAESKGFSYIGVDYETQEECFAALDSGEVDGVAMGSLALKPDYKIVCRFGSDPFYFMSGLQNDELVEELNDALSQIKAANPFFEANLYNRYYGANASDDPLFTRKEAEYIAEAEPVKIALIPNRAPFSMVTNGVAEGITIDILKLIQEKSGLPFEYDVMDVNMNTVSYLEKHPDAIVAGIMTDNPGFQNTKYLLSDSFYSDNIALACRTDMVYDLDADNASYTLAIPATYVALQNFIINDYPQFQIITGASNEECMKLVLDGKADFMAQNVNVITPYLSDPHFEGIMVLPTYFMEERTGMVGLNTSENQLLMSIFDKCIGTITDKEESQITVNHTIKNAYQMSFPDMLYKFRVTILLILLLVVACMLLMGRNVYQKRKSNRNLSMKNRQLAEAVAQADNANHAKSTFLARMSHEIRTPMNAIVGLTTIAKHHETEPERMDEYLSKIEISSKVLLNIINDVLDMSAIESDKMKLADGPFDIREVLMSVSTIYYPQCRQKGIRFDMDVSELEHERLIGDGLRVNQILLNLVSNAYKFTSDGGKIRIVAKEVREHEGRAYVSFSVEDTGEGMSQEMQERLFKPFEQEAALTAKNHGGSGLGLSIAKNLVEMMHGSISCSSEKGKGTTFTVMIPFTIDQEAIEMTETHLKEIRALIVDDEADTREYTGVILDRIGVAYDMAANGAEAVQKLEAEKAAGSGYDICFVDWRMPDLDGGEVTRQIRKLYKRDTLVIIVSAYDVSEIEEEAGAAGADLTISKPLFQSSVFNLLMKLTGGKFVKQTANADTYDFQGKKALLAEDTEFNAEIAQELLAMVNLQVDHAWNGVEAVKLFEESAPGTYSLILMDVQMPELDGYAATRQIRAGAHPEAKTIPIYAMTANAFTEDVSEALNAGMNGHIAKPIDTDVLYGTINKVLQKQSNRQIP